MWQRFTERARRCIFFAQEEAGKHGEHYVSTEHILLGLIREEDSVAATILDRLGIGLNRIRSEVERQMTRGSGRMGDMQLTPNAKRVIDLAYDEARQFTNNYIGTEHLLLGLIRAEEGLAGRVLAKLGADLERARREVMAMQDQSGAKQGVTAPTNQDRQAIAKARKIIAENSLTLRGTSLLSMADLTREQTEGVLSVAAGMEAAHRLKIGSLRCWEYPRSLAMIFEKPSLRTRVTFDLGMRQLGGLTTILGPAEIGLGSRESVPDVARNLERWVDAVMARVFDHNVLVQLRDHCGIPVINGLSDREHPCQILADLFTVQQKRGTLEGQKLAWIGDGNNVLHSLLLGGARVGMSVAAACPQGYWPDPDVVLQAKSFAAETGAQIEVVADCAAAADGADVVYTDVWTSMGQEAEQLARIQAFRAYQVNAELMAHAKPDAIFMHCLPAHRGDEVTDAVIDGPQSVVFQQAENRLHAQKAVLALLIGI